jgi:hypothetical protein
MKILVEFRFQFFFKGFDFDGNFSYLKKESQKPSQ